jgi:hypothetical protein
MQLQYVRKISAYRNSFFSAAGIFEQKEEKTSKRSQPVAMFPCFSLPAVCACAIQKVELGLGIWIQCYGKFSCEMRYLLQSLLDNFVSSHFSGIVNLLSTAGLATAQLNHAEKPVEVFNYRKSLGSSCLRLPNVR